MAKNRKTPDMNLPVWFDGQNINEALFCEEFLHERRIIFANGAFFTPDGRVTDDLPLRGEIYDKLKFCAVNNIPRKITNILEVLKLEAQVSDFPPEQDRIHVANGTLLLNGTFTEGRPAIVRSRLPVGYNPDAPAPVIWLNFLDGLLYAEDIPTLQEFIGYAEMEDFLINTLGGFSGYIVCTAICERKTNRRKAVVSIVTLCLTLALCSIGIYAVGDNEKQLPDGLSAVENSIAEINVYSEGEERSISIDSYQYRSFASQISNCGGHLLEIQKTSEGEIWNDTDCFIEIIYTADQTIKFENAENFSIECADRLLYNADKNVLYWGEAGYQNCLDYTKMNEEMQAHKEEILKGYEELSTSIRDCFNQ